MIENYTIMGEFVLTDDPEDVKAKLIYMLEIVHS